ncbi:MAG: transglutaminase-like cysteine peptidase [Pseudomonadota bacterium]
MNRIRICSAILCSALFLIASGSKSADPLISDEMLNHLRSNHTEEAYRRGLAANELLNELEGKSVEHQLTEVNRFFNQFAYQEDDVVWGAEDYWATPTEFIGARTGDCEDFVIAKYFALRKLGVPDDRLYLTYVKALKQNVAHMVLSYFETPGSIPLVLDNYNPMILTADKRNDLLPVYSFNAESLFLTNASAGLGQSLPTNKIKNSKWKKLLSDIQKEKQ